MAFVCNFLMLNSVHFHSCALYEKGLHEHFAKFHFLCSIENHLYGFGVNGGRVCILGKLFL